MTTIFRGRVIDGVSDRALDNGLVAVEGETIAYVGPWAGYAIPEDAQVWDAPTILPGFYDCHAHLSGAENAGGFAGGRLFGDQLLGAAYQCGLLVDSGFVGVRDMSEQGFYLSRAQERGVLRAPRIMPGGRCLSITSGHGDAALYLSKEQSNALNSTCMLVDGKDECVRAVREQFRKGAKFIKVLATGGVSSPVDDVNDVQFSPEELQAIVDEAKRRGSYVAAHCTGPTGAYQALQCGVTCIEHGVMLTQREIDRMAETDATLVSTLWVALNCAKLPGMPDWFIRKANLCAQANLNTIAMARRAGIRIALGTDFSNSKTTPFAHIGREFAAMVEAGMTPMEAIRAGTVNGAYLMRMDDRAGSLQAGKLADIVLCDADPLSDITCLADSRHITGVFMAGRRVK